MATTMQRVGLTNNSALNINQKASNDNISTNNRLNSQNSQDNLDKLQTQPKAFQKSKFESIQNKTSSNILQPNIEEMLLKSPLQQSQQGMNGYSFDQQSMQMNTPRTNPVNTQDFNPRTVDLLRESAQLHSQIDNGTLNARHRRNQATQNIGSNMESSVQSAYEDSRNRLQIQQSTNQNNSFNLSTPQNKVNTGEIKAIKRQLSRTNSIDIQESQLKDGNPQTDNKNLSIFRREKQPTTNQINPLEAFNLTSQISNEQNQKSGSKRVDFVDGDEYFFFDPKFKIKDLNTLQNSKLRDENSPPNRLFPKKILKIHHSDTPNALQLGRNDSQKLKKLKSSQDISQIKSTQKNPPTKSDSVLDSANEVLDTEKLQIDQNNDQIVSPVPSNSKNMRQRAGIIILNSAEGNTPLLNNALINKLQLNIKSKTLNDYEKTYYMRRSSDINRLIEFQKRNQNRLSNKFLNIIKGFFNFIISVISLNIYKVTQSKYCNLVSQAKIELHNTLFNITLVGLFIFLYAIIQLYQEFADSNDFNPKIFLNNINGYLAYSGHFFIALFILTFIKLSSSIRDFSMNKKKQGFLLVFSEYKWNGKTGQLRCLAKKFKWLDQIYENIDVNESFDLVIQSLIIWVIEIALLAIDSACIYFILDDSYLYSEAESLTSNNHFLSRLIVAVLTSLLLIANNYIIQFVFSCFQQVDFYFYENRKYSFMFFNQMFILISYQVKVMAYLNPEYKPSYFELKINDSYELSYLNLTLVISEFAISLLERLLISLLYTLQYKREKRQQPIIKINNTQILPIQTIDNVLTTKLQMGNTYVTKDDNSNEQIVNKKDAAKSENNSTGINGQGDGHMKQSTISQFKDFSESLQMKMPQPRLSKQIHFYNYQNVSGSFRLIKNSISIISINYLILSNCILQPSILIVGVVVNSVFKIFQHYEQMQVQNYLSSFSYGQFNSLVNLTSLIALLASFFFNFVVGFNVKPQTTEHVSLFSSEFSYLFDIQRLNSIVKIITLPYLLFPIIILLSVLLLQQKQFQKNHESIFRDSYYKLKHSQSNTKPKE